MQQLTKQQVRQFLTNYDTLCYKRYNQLDHLLYTKLQLGAYTYEYELDLIATHSSGTKYTRDWVQDTTTVEVMDQDKKFVFHLETDQPKYSVQYKDLTRYVGEEYAWKFVKTLKSGNIKVIISMYDTGIFHLIYREGKKDYAEYYRADRVYDDYVVLDQEKHQVMMKILGGYLSRQLGYPDTMPIGYWNLRALVSMYVHQEYQNIFKMPYEYIYRPMIEKTVADIHQQVMKTTKQENVIELQTMTI